MRQHEDEDAACLCKCVDMLLAKNDSLWHSASAAEQVTGHRASRKTMPSQSSMQAAALPGHTKLTIAWPLSWAPLGGMFDGSLYGKPIGGGGGAQRRQKERKSFEAYPESVGCPCPSLGPAQTLPGGTSIRCRGCLGGSAQKNPAPKSEPKGRSAVQLGALGAPSKLLWATPLRETRPTKGIEPKPLVLRGLRLPVGMRTTL